MRDVLHTYSRTQLILISHGSSVNYERSKIIAEIEYDQKKESNVDASQVRSYHRTEEGNIEPEILTPAPFGKRCLLTNTVISWAYRDYGSEK